MAALVGLCKRKRTRCVRRAWPRRASVLLAACNSINGVTSLRVCGARPPATCMHCVWLHVRSPVRAWRSHARTNERTHAQAHMHSRTRGRTHAPGHVVLLAIQVDARAPRLLRLVPRDAPAGRARRGARGSEGVWAFGRLGTGRHSWAEPARLVLQGRTAGLQALLPANDPARRAPRLRACGCLGRACAPLLQETLSQQPTCNPCACGLPLMCQ